MIEGFSIGWSMLSSLRPSGGSSGGVFSQRGEAIDLRLCCLSRRRVMSCFCSCVLVVATTSGVLALGVQFANRSGGSLYVDTSERSNHRVVHFGPRTKICMRGL